MRLLHNCEFWHPGGVSPSKLAKCVAADKERPLRQGLPLLSEITNASGSWKTEQDWSLIQYEMKRESPGRLISCPAEVNAGGSVMTCMVESVWSCRAERERDATSVAGRRGTAVCSMSPYIYSQQGYCTLKKKMIFFCFVLFFLRCSVIWTSLTNKNLTKLLNTQYQHSYLYREWAQYSVVFWYRYRYPIPVSVLISNTGIGTCIQHWYQYLY